MDKFIAKTPEQLGAILRGYRQKQSLTQEQLAARLGLPQKTISIAETHCERVNVARLFQILGALGIELTLAENPSRQTSKSEW
jgi:HTH-type transcriptional regulator/antitoxin HipB